MARNREFRLRNANLMGVRLILLVFMERPARKMPMGILVAFLGRGLFIAMLVLVFKSAFTHAYGS